jgi:hypothetical protein
MVAEVTADSVVGAVERQRYTAMRAGGGYPAGGADEGAGMPASVEEKDGLFATRETVAQAIDQFTRE